MELWGVLNDHDQYDHVSTSAFGQAGTSYHSILLEPPTTAQESGAAAPATQQSCSRHVCVRIPLGEGGVASVRVLPAAVDQ